MPELPEVETVCRGLAPVMAGAIFERVEQNRADLRFPFPERFAARLVGRRMIRLSRRAKYLVAEIEGGEALIMHLGMSGRFSVAAAANCSASGPLGQFAHATGGGQRHDHVVFHMSSGAVVTYNDPRRFGFMDLTQADEIDRHKLFAGLGPEPLSNAFDAVYLAGRAAGKRVDLKALLLDQRIVAGLGNIYVSEALFRAGLSPRRSASTLARGPDARPTAHAERLVPEIRRVLEDAIRAGGSSLRDYHHADGTLGEFQKTFSVYAREGEPCGRVGCGGHVARMVQAGRSTFWCRGCQR